MKKNNKKAILRNFNLINGHLNKTNKMRTLRKIFKSVLILVLFSHSNGYERITDDAIIVEGIKSFNY